jgi:hypothetical protein
MPKVTIQTITCIKPNESSDEIFLKVNGERVWGGDNGRDISPGTTIEVGYSFTYGNSVTIELWEDDTPLSGGDHDFIAQNKFELFSIGDDLSFEGHGDGSHYKVNYRVEVE